VRGGFKNEQGFLPIDTGDAGATPANINIKFLVK
jgi:hypothetical protein